MPFLGQKQCFLGSGGQLNTPHPMSQVLDSEKHVLQGWGAEKLVIQGRPPQKNGHFLPKNGLKMPILGQKQCF